MFPKIAERIYYDLSSINSYPRAFDNAEVATKVPEVETTSRREVNMLFSTKVLSESYRLFIEFISA